MGVIQFKSGVTLVGAPGGVRILSAADQFIAKQDYDFVVTSGSDGEHSGPADPHHFGNAYDFRSHDFTSEQKDTIIAQVMAVLGWDRFYGFLEAPGTDQEHFHFQVKKGTVYP